MVFNGRWDNPKVVLYCQAGQALDMLDFSLHQAVDNAGLPPEDYDLVVICWRTSPEVYRYLKERQIKYVDMAYEPDQNFVWNLYKGWNMGYEVGFAHAPYVCPIATDHAFYKNWLRNLLAAAGPNRIVNCKLIEPGTLPTIHTAANLGLTVQGQFQQEAFEKLCAQLYRDELVSDEKAYGHRLDAMPFVCPQDVWQRFGPMNPNLLPGRITGDTDFFDRAKAGGVEITKALNAISYHCGGIETYRRSSLFKKAKIRLGAKLPPGLRATIKKIIS